MLDHRASEEYYSCENTELQYTSEDPEHQIAGRWLKVGLYWCRSVSQYGLIVKVNCRGDYRGHSAGRRTNGKQQALDR
jgi:hypothetical protein